VNGVATGTAAIVARMAAQTSDSYGAGGLW